VIRIFVVALIAFGLLHPSEAMAEASPTVLSEPCAGVSMTISVTLDAKIEELNKAAADLKDRLHATSDPIAAGDLTNRLEKIQGQLLDLLFERECLRKDLTVQIQRAPGEPPPPWIEITTFFATNRKATGSAAPDMFFGSDREQRLQFGKTVVSIPTSRQPGTMNLPSLWKFELSADPNKHFIFKDVIPLDADAAHAELSKILANSTKKTLLIFVHGYNVGFADAALRTAQLAHDLSFGGTAIFFSWPSAANARGYWRDEEVIQLSQGVFDEFLDRMADVGASEIFLIAHSMGNRLVTTVLNDRAARGKSLANLRELFLAAPDINAEIFREMIVPGMAKLQGVHRTIYASSSDIALRASKIVHDYPRVGESDGGVLTFEGFETVDASGVAPLLRAFGHSYVVDSAKVLGDIAETLTLHFTADQRNLQRGGAPPGQWWLLR
jgi:esterase/lipase superfamily enzyme